MAKDKVNKKKYQDVWGKTMRTPMGRLIFAAIAKPDDFKGNQQFRFGCSLVVSPSPAYSALVAEIERVALEAWGDEYKETPKLFAMPIMSGERRMEKSEKAPASLYAGNFVITASCRADKKPPDCLVGKNLMLPRAPGNEEHLKAIAAQFYDGSYCALAITPHTYAPSENNRGVALLLRGIRFLKDGQRIGAPDLDEVFGEDDYDLDSSVGESDNFGSESLNIDSADDLNL